MRGFGANGVAPRQVVTAEDVARWEYRWRQFTRLVLSQVLPAVCASVAVTLLFGAIVGVAFAVVVLGVRCAVATFVTAIEDVFCDMDHCIE